MAKKENSNEKSKNNFFRELKSELKKVTWPTFKKLVNNTSAVISIVLIVSVIVFILDVCFENLNKFGVGKIKTLVSTETENVEETDETTDLEDGVELIPSEENVEVEETEVDSQEQTDNNSETEEVVE